MFPELSSGLSGSSAGSKSGDWTGLWPCHGVTGATLSFGLWERKSHEHSLCAGLDKSPQGKVLGGSKVNSRERLAGEGDRGPGQATSTPGRSSGLACQQERPRQGPAYVHQGRADVIAGFSIHRDEEGQAAVQREDVHAPVLIVVPGQEPDAAVLGPDTGRHDVEGLGAQRWTGTA